MDKEESPEIEIRPGLAAEPVQLVTDQDEAPALDSMASANFNAAKAFDPRAMVGSVVGKNYEIEDLLGAGGMSYVYRAKHILLHQTVAIKFLASAEVATDNAYRRFQREAQAASQLRHDNIAAVREFGLTDDNQPYIVMDFVDGEPLSDLLQRQSSLSPEQAISIASQIADGLQYAHANGVIHRDVKPANVILGKDSSGNMVAKIVDFGIAKVLEEPDKQSNLTQTGDVLGTPYYMSPEQCYGRKLDARSDIYSLGCVLHEMLTGRPPFQGASILETIVKHTNEEYQGLGSVSAPLGLEQVIRRALDKESRNRHQSMQALRYDLQAVSKGQPLAPTTRRDRDRELLLRRGAAWLVDTILLMVLSVVFGMFISGLSGAFDFAVQAVFEQLAPASSMFTQMETYSALPFLLPAIFVANTVYHALMESSKRRATFGKLWMGLEVTKLTGNQITFAQALLRHCAKTAFIVLIGSVTALPYALIAPMFGQSTPDTFWLIILIVTLSLIMWITFLMRKKHQLPFDWLTKCKVSIRDELAP